MKITTAGRILADWSLHRGLRENYWAVDAHLRRLLCLSDTSLRVFAHQLVRDQVRFWLGAVKPVRGETTERARAAVEWILRAQGACLDGGVSLGYFPCDEPAGWKASYPETTGYIITSLLSFADRYGDDHVRREALRMADWEVQVQMPSGAVQGGVVCTPEKQTPAAFNTGMVLDGWCTAYAVSGNTSYLEAARRAADFLVLDLDSDGYFRTNGQFVRADRIKTYNCLCAWAMYRFGDLSGDSRYREAAVQAVRAAVRQQQSNGWIANNCQSHPEAPLLHTIGYTLQGMLEVGLLAGLEEFVQAAQKGVDPILDRMPANGFLHGRFYADWQPACFSSCLTGSAQLAVVSYRLYEKTAVARYRLAADAIVDYLKVLQVHDSEDPAINGALAGSFPLMGSYMTAGYPNWAAKYFLDSLMLQDRLAAC